MAVLAPRELAADKLAWTKLPLTFSKLDSVGLHSGLPNDETRISDMCNVMDVPFGQVIYYSIAR